MVRCVAGILAERSAWELGIPEDLVAEAVAVDSRRTITTAGPGDNWSIARRLRTTVGCTVSGRMQKKMMMMGMQMTGRRLKRLCFLFLSSLHPQLICFNSSLESIAAAEEASVRQSRTPHGIRGSAGRHRQESLVGQHVPLSVARKTEPGHYFLAWRVVDHSISSQRVGVVMARLPLITDIKGGGAAVASISLQFGDSRNRPFEFNRFFCLCLLRPATLVLINRNRIDCCPRTSMWFCTTSRHGIKTSWT